MRAYNRDVESIDISYSFEANTSAMNFILIPSTGEITTRQALDREMTPFYTFAVLATYTTNGSQVTARAEVVIEIADINDEAPIFEPHVYIVRSVTTISQIDDLVVTVTATDADIGSNAEVEYRLESDFFVINQTTGKIFAYTILFCYVHVRM